MKIAIQTFHGPDRMTVYAGEAREDDAEVVKKHPEFFVDPDVAAEKRRPRVHGPVQAATARPGERSDARAAKPRKTKTKTKTGDAEPEEGA